MITANPNADSESTLKAALIQKAASEAQLSLAPKSLIGNIENGLVAFLAFAALALCGYNVIARALYPAWTLEMVDEVQVYLIIWSVFISLGSITYHSRHVRADLILNLLSPKWIKKIEKGIDGLGLIFAFTLLGSGILITLDSYSYGDVSTTTLRFPLWIYIAALPAGALMIVIGISARIRNWRNSNKV
mgnify:CR=1 FL=1